jgi:hypothetical protein
VLKSYPATLAGMTAISLGGECQGLGRSNILIDWFRTKELSMAFGISFSTIKLSRFVSSNTQPGAASSDSLLFSYSIGVIVCFFSLICSFIVLLVNRKKNTLLGLNENVAANKKFRFSDLKNFELSFWLVCLNMMFTFVDILCFLNIASDYYQKSFNYESIEVENILVVGALSDEIGRRGEAVVLAAIIVTSVHACLYLLRKLQGLFILYFVWGR